MKSRPIFLAILLLALLIPAAAGVAAHAAGDWSLPLSAATSGGGHSAGGELALQGVLGQAAIGRSSGGTLMLNGGLLGELLPSGRTMYLPLIFRQGGEPWTYLAEAEPNNTFGTANPVAPLPLVISGVHDGAADTGDVFAVALSVGPVLHAGLDTGNPDGVQFLAYDPAGEEILRDIEPPYSLVFAPTYAGTYYLYVFTPAGVNNQAAYTLRLWTAGTQVETQPAAMPLLPERLDLAPAIRP